MINLSAAAAAYIDNHRAASQWRTATSPESITARAQSSAALTAAEEVWHALIGQTGQDAMDTAERLAAAGSDSLLLQFTGTDPGNTDTQMLIQVWQDASANIAYRDTSERMWGPPYDLDPA